MADLSNIGKSRVSSPTDVESVPLVVDVDGTLLRADLLVESAVHLFVSRPLDVLKIPQWLMVGKARLKIEIADRVAIDIETLPLDSDVLEFMRDAKLQGRRVFLASASDRRLIEAIARRVGFIDGVFATERENFNLSGPRKRDALVQAFGEGGFDYVGNSRADIPVWKAARLSHVVRRGLFNFTPTQPNEERAPKRLGRQPVTLALIVKALRLHQWAKNLLLFVPLFVGGAAGNGTAIFAAISCFVALGILASSTYLINDILDLTNDRQHAVKRFRPLANGVFSVVTAAAFSLLGIGIGLGIGALLGLPVFLALLGYLTFTLAYSWRLKRMPIVDVSLLASLYTWRLFLGVLVAHVVLSAWLMVFAFSFFLSLSLTKRYAEISSMIVSANTALPGRGYRIADGPFVMTMGIAAGVSSILIFVLYLIEGAFHAAYFTTPQALWASPVILLLWLCRIWLICGRGELHSDPVEFAITDRKSLLLGAIGAITVAISLFA